MTKLLIKVLKIKNFFIFISIFTYLVLNFNSVAEGNNNSSKILWKKIKRNKKNNNQIKWEQYNGAIDLDIKKEYPYEIKFVNESLKFTCSRDRRVKREIIFLYNVSRYFVACSTFSESKSS